jgi:hypothetical protein
LVRARKASDKLPDRRDDSLHLRGWRLLGLGIGTRKRCNSRHSDSMR